MKFSSGSGLSHFPQPHLNAQLCVQTSPAMVSQVARAFSPSPVLDVEGWQPGRGCSKHLLTHNFELSHAVNINRAAFNKGPSSSVRGCVRVGVCGIGGSLFTSSWGLGGVGSHEPATREPGRVKRSVTAEEGGASTWELRPGDPAEGPTQRHCGRDRQRRDTTLPGSAREDSTKFQRRSGTHPHG